jgi:hypothetical protein
MSETQIFDEQATAGIQPHSAAETKEKPQETVTFVDGNQRFQPLSSKELAAILGLTIKRDDVNKLVTFLCELSAYTDNSQFNISYNAPSSSGKSFIPTEIAALFPQDDVVEVGYCSPTAFFHDHGAFDEEQKTYTVDLSGKIMVFLDQPHMLLLQHLRPMLSHDKKEIQIKITDSKKKFGLVTKNIVLRGFPAVIFCTAGLRIDEQESTRFLLLSPEINQEKIKEGVDQVIAKEGDNAEFRLWLEASPERGLLKQRIEAIKQAGIKDIKIPKGLHQSIKQQFYGEKKWLKPRHQRDAKRLMALIKLFAVLNFWWRSRDGEFITANGDDLAEAFAIWDRIAESQELNLPPYVYDLYQQVLVAGWQEKLAAQWSEPATGQFFAPEKSKAVGLTRMEIAKKHVAVYGRHIPDWQLRQEIIPMLESSGLIMQEADPADRRKVLIYPTTEIQKTAKERNSEPVPSQTLDIPSAVESIGL